MRTLLPNSRPKLVPGRVSQRMNGAITWSPTEGRGEKAGQVILQSLPPTPVQDDSRRRLGDLGSQRICRDQSPSLLPRHWETQRHQSLDGGDIFPLGVRGGLVYFFKKGKEISAGIRYAILAALPWGNKLHIALYTNTAPNTDPAGSTVPFLSLGK